MLYPCGCSSGYRADGALHSFPTRRSSDLFQQIFDAFQEFSVLVFHGQRLTDETQMAFSRRFGPLETTINATGRERSEEHTSELQSRGHLVCRLLLEKKKHHTLTCRRYGTS